jgi:hypothetical protein
MLKLKRNVVITAVTLAFLGLGTSGVAFASDGGSPSNSQTSTQDDDQAAQDAACKAAGVPLSADNIDYDDATGVCKLDSGSGDAEGTE